MKYIRTKDKILPALKVDSHHFANNKQGNIIPDWSVKQADTIEELIDELVVVEPNNEDCPRPYVLDCFHLCTYNSWFEREKEHIKIGTITVYGSIWVDGNLNKVAKNE